MSGPEFFQTPMGRKFYEADVPRIAKALEKLAQRSEIGARAERIAAMAASIAAGICTQERGALEVAEKAVEIALDIEKLVARLPGEAL